MRLLQRLYPSGQGPSKVSRRIEFEAGGFEVLAIGTDEMQWWLSFTKRKFMGKSL